jgi:hypothetical protein
MDTITSGEHTNESPEPRPERGLEVEAPTWRVMLRDYEERAALRFSGAHLHDDHLSSSEGQAGTP